MKEKGRTGQGRTGQGMKGPSFLPPFLSFPSFLTGQDRGRLTGGELGGLSPTILSFARFIDLFESAWQHCL
jgi:hypothetical protein